MIAGVFRYSFVQARARTMKGTLLSPEDWHYLLKMRSVEDILRYLRGTHYIGPLSNLSGPGSEGVSLALHDDLFKDYGTLLKAVPAKSARILKSFLLRYAAENLKTILRGIWKEKPSSEITPLLYRTGALCRLPVEELLQVRRITEAVDLLKKTTFHISLLHALPQFQAQGRLFPLEIAVDTAAVEHIRSSFNRLRGIDRKNTRTLVGKWIDLVNLSWLVRFRHFYDLSSEEAINYILPGGLRLGVRDLGPVARANDLAAFLAALPDPYRKVLTRTEQWARVHSLLDGWLVRELYRTFSQDPFQVQLPLSYLLLKEMEVKALASLLSAVELGEPVEKLTEWISLPVESVNR